MTRNATIGLFITTVAIGAIAGTLWLVRAQPQARTATRTIESAAAQALPRDNSATITLERFRRAGEPPQTPAAADVISQSMLDAVIRSRPVLARVARDHSIMNSKWGASLRATEPGGEDRIIDSLRNAIQVRAVEGTGYFSMTLTAGSAAEAAHIVTAIADAYMIEDRARTRDALEPLQIALQERVKDIESTLRNIDTQREVLQSSRQLSGTDECWSIARMAADAAVKELAAANATARAPGGDTPANQERIAALTNDVERARQVLLEEGLVQQQLRNFIAEQADLRAERARLREKLADLNAQSMAGSTLRIIETPRAKPEAGDEKGA